MKLVNFPEIFHNQKYHCGLVGEKKSEDEILFDVHSFSASSCSQVN